MCLKSILRSTVIPVKESVVKVKSQFGVKFPLKVFRKLLCVEIVSAFSNQCLSS